MKRFILVLIAAFTFTGTPNVVHADVAGLTPCKDSAVFKKRLDGSVKKLTARLENYEEGTPAYLALEAQIEKTKVPPISRICVRSKTLMEVPSNFWPLFSSTKKGGGSLSPACLSRRR